MKTHFIPVIILMSSMTTACVTWPVLGTGGMAEHQTNQMQYDSGLFVEFELAKTQLSLLTLKGAEYCFPATIIQARQRQNRILRQLHGGLELDAANDLIIQRDHLKQLENRFNAVISQSSCVPPTEEQIWLSETQIEHLHHLLNSGPQFQANSNALADDYISRLAEACFLLRETGKMTLHITAHVSKAHGSNDQQQLAESRSLMIKRYLQLFGIQQEYIHVSTVNTADSLLVEHVKEGTQSEPKVSVILADIRFQDVIEETKNEH